MKRFKNLALFTCSTLCSLLLAELLLRAMKPEAANFNHHQLYCEYDPLLGWRKTPNSRGHHKTPEYEVWENINSMGIRGPEYPLAKDSGEYRIAILGDSFAEGYTVGFDSLFSEILEKKMRGTLPHRSTEVINLGTGGYSTDQELLCFESLGAKFQPDATLLLFCVNDPWFNNQPRYYSRGFKPFFVLAGDSLQLSNVPVPQMTTRPVFSKAKDWLLENSELVRRAKNLRDNARHAADRQSVPYEWRIYQKTQTPEMKAAWQVTAALLQRLKEKTAEAGSSFTVFYIAEKTEVYPADWQDFLATYNLDAIDFDPAAPRQRLQAICDSLHIPLINPTTAFVESAKSNPKAPLYFKHDWHWNEHGHQLAGEVLAKYFEVKRQK